jgi:hypothetical protein
LVLVKKFDATLLSDQMSQISQNTSHPTRPAIWSPQGVQHFQGLDRQNRGSKI